jgi:Rrf2 family protein
LISRTSAYAMEATLVIARQPAGEPVRAGDLAGRLELPRNYLSKILNSLVHAGVLRSDRGPTGGFRLGLDPAEITVEDIIGRFEDVGASRRCFLGRGQCSDTNSCPMHDQWKRISRPMFDFFHETTLADLILAEDRRSRRKTRPARGGSAKERGRAPAVGKRARRS